MLYQYPGTSVLHFHPRYYCSWTAKATTVSLVILMWDIATEVKTQCLVMGVLPAFTLYLILSMSHPDA